MENVLCFLDAGSSNRIQHSPGVKLKLYIYIVVLRNASSLSLLPPNPTPPLILTPSWSEQSASSTAPMETAYVWARWSATSWITVGTTVMRRTALWSPSILHQASSAVSGAACCCSRCISEPVFTHIRLLFPLWFILLPTSFTSILSQRVSCQSLLNLDTVNTFVSAEILSWTTAFIPVRQEKFLLFAAAKTQEKKLHIGF